MLTVASDNSSMNKTRVYEWYNRFREDREDMQYDNRSGRAPQQIDNDNDSGK